MEFSEVYRITLAVLNVIANLIILLLAGALITIGIIGIVLVNVQLSASSFVLYLNAAFGLVLGIGLFIALASLFSVIGSYTSCNPKNGALKGISICLLAIAVCGMVIILLSGIVIVILTVVYSRDIQTTFTSSLLRFFNDTLENNPSSIEETIVTMQVTFSCCGVNGPSDYADIPAIGNNTALPGGCCFRSNSSCTLNGNPTEYRSDGCGTIILDLLTAYSYVIIGLGVALLIVAVSAIVLPMILICFVSKKSGEMRFV